MRIPLSANEIGELERRERHAYQWMKALQYHQIGTAFGGAIWVPALLIATYAGWLDGLEPSERVALLILPIVSHMIGRQLCPRTFERWRAPANRLRRDRGERQIGPGEWTDTDWRPGDRVPWL